MTTVHVTTAPGGFEFRSPYDPFVIDTIKNSTRNRTWDPATKVWTIHPRSAAEWAVRTLEAAGYAVAWADRPHERQRQQKPRQGRQDPAAEWAAAMFAAVPDRLAKPVYLALMKALHPDIGGDSTVAKQVTAAYERHQVIHRTKGA